MRCACEVATFYSLSLVWATLHLDAQGIQVALLLPCTLISVL